MRPPRLVEHLLSLCAGVRPGRAERAGRFGGGACRSGSRQPVGPRPGGIDVKPLGCCCEPGRLHVGRARWPAPPSRLEIR